MCSDMTCTDSMIHHCITLHHWLHCIKGFSLKDAVELGKITWQRPALAVEQQQQQQAVECNGTG